MGENLQIKDYVVVEGGTTGSYVHSNGKVAALVVAEGSADEEKLKQVAMHATAANPEYLSPDDISDEIVEKEKALQLEIMKNSHDTLYNIKSSRKPPIPPPILSGVLSPGGRKGI